MAGLGAVSSGVSGLLLLSALFVLVVAVIALIRGHITWALLRNRAAAGIAVGVSIVLFTAGGAVADKSAPTATRPSSNPPHRNSTPTTRG